MNRRAIFVLAALIASSCLAATPALARQHRGGSGRGSSVARGPVRTAPPVSAPVRSYRGPSPIFRSPGRGYGVSRGFGPGVVFRGSYPYAAQSRGVYGRPQGRAVFRAVPRRVFVAPIRFYRPYYAFRPRFSIGFGIWAGYPIAYSSAFYYGYPFAYDPYYPAYGYPYPYPAYGPPPGYGYPAPYPYSAYPTQGYPAQGYPTAAAPQSGYSAPSAPEASVIAQPGTASGSISFEITPSTAEVFIDGSYVGRVADLGPTTQPLALTLGRHRVEVRASGYETISMDVDIVAGQVIPYRGQMQPVR